MSKVTITEAGTMRPLNGLAGGECFLFDRETHMVCAQQSQMKVQTVRLNDGSLRYFERSSGIVVLPVDVQMVVSPEARA